MMRKQVACFSAIAALACVMVASDNSFAQIAENQKAVLAFDIYFDRLATSDLAKATGMDDPSKALGPAAGAPDDAIKPDELYRVMGAISAPPNLASIQGLSDGAEQLDFNFFARLQFKGPAATDTAFAEMSKDCEAVSVGGKEYHRPPVKEGTPKNILFHRLSSDVIEIATDTYMTLPDRNVFSNNLTQAWIKMPKAAIRVAADLDGSRHLIDEGLKMAEGNVPPMAQPALSMVNNMAALRIGLDFSSNDLLWLTATGRDESATGQINATLGGLLAMAKGFGQQSLPMAGPDAQGPGGELLAALATKVEGNDVNIILPRPAGFEKAIGGAVSQMMMMGGGMGPGAGMEPGNGADPFGGDAMDAPPVPANAGGADPFGGGGDADPFGGGGDADPFGN
ncbi:hypothetical protein [Stieleria marina]|uniref:DUF2125 domain-containing protein n=1 Tax=Stieleria marina TaxID=1930275 RepID=A0A517NVY0_9BACT|nr:hypothetical protein K239x_32520 [Planctomycetes bacterium K23_9]